MKKFTKATLKKFIKDNAKSLYIRIDSHFDWMTDCVEQIDNPTLKQVDHKKIDFTKKYNWWIEWLRLIWSSWDRFEKNENKVEVRNCCGMCTLVAI